ncbi:MAG: DUF2723 domain-containing protein [Thermoanaerobaculia bacterium]
MTPPEPLSSVGKRVRDGISGPDRLLAAVLAIATFAVYVSGACRTIFVGDSGELVTAAHVLGIPHPSGYPLYVLLGKLWTLVFPFGSIAWRMSIFSALFAAAAVGVLALAVRETGAGRIAAAFAGLLLAFSGSFWAEANIQRVYSLNALAVALATLLAFRWFRTRRTSSLVLASVVCGLGAANHTFMAVYAIALAIAVVWCEPAVLRQWKLLGASAAAFVAGLLPYLYLPIRARMHPVLNWDDPETLRGTLDVILRREFWGRSWIETPFDFVRIGADFGASLLTELVWVGVPLAIVGMVLWRRKRWPVILPLAVITLNVLVVGMHGSQHDIFVWHRYYIPAYAMAAILAALGLDSMTRFVPRPLAAAVLIIPLATALVAYPRYDRSRFRIAEDFSRQVLECLPPGATLFANDDNVLFVLIYLHDVEHVRPDVKLLMEGVGGTHYPNFTFDPDVDPVFFTHDPNWRVPGLEIVPVGPLFRAWRSGRPAPPRCIESLHLDGELDPAVPKDFLTQNLIGHFHYMLGRTLSLDDWNAGTRQYREAVAAAPQNDVLFYNLGVIYSGAGLYDEAIGFFRHSAALTPRGIPSQASTSGHAEGGRAQASSKVPPLLVERERIRQIESSLVASHSDLAALRAGSAAYHARLAELLAALGETTAARGETLSALNQDSDTE